MYSDSGTFQQPHGNSKKRKEPYMRTFPSVMKKIKSIGSVSAPKEVVSKIQVMAGGAFNLSSASEVARDKTEVYNALRNISRPKSRNTGHPKSTDHHKLQMLPSQGDYIKSVEYVSNDNNKIKPRVFATTDSLMKWTGQFCSTSRKSSQLGIDMTYKCGPFYVTGGSFPHPSFVWKNDSYSHPTVVAFVLTHVKKEADDYKFVASKLKDQAKENCLIYGPDGEFALEKSLEEIFPIEDVVTGKTSIHLRCFDHVKTDIERFLSDRKVQISDRERIVKEVLGSEYRGTR